jgi:hypothetical protein
VALVAPKPPPVEVIVEKTELAPDEPELFPLGPPAPPPPIVTVIPGLNEIHVAVR